MLSGKLYWCTLKQPEFVLARQLAKGNYRAGKGDRADGCSEEQLKTIARGDGIAQMTNDAQ